MFTLKRLQATRAGPYVFAVVAVCAAALTREAINPIAHDKGPFMFFAFAVVAAALYGGLRGGVTATVLSVLLSDFLFIEPRYTLFIHDAFGDTLLIFLLTGLGIAQSVIIDRLNRANERVRRSGAALAEANALLESRHREVELANERFRMATEAANEAIWEFDLKTGAASWSDLYAKSFGSRPADASMDWWFDHIHPEDRDRVRQTLYTVIQGTQNAWASEYRMLRADGSWARVYDRASIARDSEGTALRAVGAILDVTDIRHAQEQLELRTRELAESNEQLKRFAFAVSHDLKAPLRMIEDQAEHLSTSALDDNSKCLVHSMQDGARRMHNIIHDLLDFATINTHAAAPFHPTDSRFILDLAMQHLQPRIRETGAHITSGRLPMVIANETRLLRVFQNLLGNAMEYCDRVPEIHVSAERDGEVWVFAVSDNGIGIPAEHHERIFGLFERFATRKHIGTGIGLALVKRIVETHGGRIWVESEVGRGSTFYFSLRAADGSVDAHAA